MEENTEKEEHVRPPSGITGGLEGRPFGFYFRLFRWPLLAVLLIEAILIIFKQPSAYLWFLNFLFFIALGIWAKNVYSLKLGQLSVLGISSGFILGLVISLFKLIWIHKLYLFFNIITETVITSLAGFLIIDGIYLFLTKEYKEKKKKPSFFKRIKNKEQSEQNKEGR